MSIEHVIQFRANFFISVSEIFINYRACRQSFGNIVKGKDLTNSTCSCGCKANVRRKRTAVNFYKKQPVIIEEKSVVHCT